MLEAVAHPAVTIDSYLNGTCFDAMAREVREGLSRPFKELPPKYFYDTRGSELFDRITELPEYYPTRAERAILNRYAPEIVARSNAHELVELGSGSASKTRALLYAMAGAGTLQRYVPLDCSEAALARSAQELVDLYPGLIVHGVVGDFEEHLDELPAGEQPLVAFLGGTIGNFYPERRREFLANVAELLGADGHLLLGTDLVKDADVLEAAYNDSAGVTAEFNRNVLHAINGSLDADFEPEQFEHVAFWDPREEWIEMRLKASAPQRVRIERAGIDVEFADGEELRTEISAKFTLHGIEAELAECGLELAAAFTDPEELFAVTLARPG